jgi:hypothetical protein
VRAGADPWGASRPAARATVPTIPPSRSGRLTTSGRSSDSRARRVARLLAPRSGRTRRNGAMARMQPACSPNQAFLARESPEYSGGAVPDSHRSSLFAGAEAAAAARPPESLEESNGCGEAVKRARLRPHDRHALPLGLPKMANLAGCDRFDRQGVPVVGRRMARAGQASRTALFR